ncbi:Peptidase family S41 [Chryseolinea serpens]|uniref:Peptidase family S41 n=1 Tax=Chryseolinea serpens TaxID=947013 RepID=A0A1M5UMH6_9BACT|nr:S41 family peptidase [Chryseolinea serpens]SHH64157.1 Peptidase family S41 [Chryseolinea serpens]
MRVFAWSLFLIASAVVVKGQSKIEKESKAEYTVEEIRQDYLIFRKALETTYPSLYRFEDSVSVTRYLDDQFKALDRSMAELEFYKIIALTCAHINDEHIIPTPSQDYYQSLQNADHYFPFSLKVLDRRLFIYKNFNLQQTLPVGAEILFINGHSAEEILNILLPTIPSDGYIQTFNIRHLEDYSMTQNESLFDLNYPIFVERTNTFRIEFIHPQSRSKKSTVTIKGLSFQDYRKFYNERIGYKAPLEFKYLQNDIAYLRIASFLRYHRNDFKQDFNNLYDSIFKQLNKKNAKNLILDLRNNEGGDGSGEKLITYLITKPYKHYDYTEEKFVGYPPVVDYLENGKDLRFNDSLVYKTNSGVYRLKDEYFNNLYKTQPPNKDHYKGKIYVLMNGASGSMASVVATFLKASDRAVFIGEEGGGTMEGNTSDSFAKLQLPNTKIRVEIPLTKKVNNVEFMKGRGVFPDYYVSPKIEDIMRGVDTELNFVLNLISTKKG